MWASRHVRERDGRLSGTIGAMRVSRLIHVLDAADLAAESSFWAGLLDGTVDAEDD
jgi:hypothetical protein